MALVIRSFKVFKKLQPSQNEGNRHNHANPLQHYNKQIKQRNATSFL